MKKTAIVIVSLFAITGMALAAPAPRSGKQVYEASCKACHEIGLSGAPKYGDRKWREMEKKEGIKRLVKDAIKGEGAMPPRGGCADCTDGEIKAAVRYMIDGAKKK
ncbi:MAG: c-type cytochrome [Nitrospirota bacterium]